MKIRIILSKIFMCWLTLGNVCPLLASNSPFSDTMNYQKTRYGWIHNAVFSFLRVEIPDRGFSKTTQKIVNSSSDAPLLLRRESFVQFYDVCNFKDPLWTLPWGFSKNNGS